MRVLVILLSMAYCCNSFAQDTPRRTIVAGTVSFSGIGISTEWNAQKRFTVETAVNFGPSYEVDDDAFFNTALAYPVYRRPALRFSVTPRIYLDGRKQVQGGHVEPYLGLHIAYVTKPFSDYGGTTDAWLFHLHAGMRQMLSRRVLFNAHLGIGRGVNGDTGEGSMYPAFNVLIGYVLVK